MKLYGHVCNELKTRFKAHQIKPLPGQIAELEAALEATLKAAPESVTVVPLVPGGGKSTLIRALLKVVAGELRDMRSPLAHRLGGIIVVVEKSDEAHELAELCNEAAGKQIAAVSGAGTAITAPPPAMKNVYGDTALTMRYVP